METEGLMCRCVDVQMCRCVDELNQDVLSFAHLHI